MQSSYSVYADCQTEFVFVNSVTDVILFYF